MTETICLACKEKFNKLISKLINDDTWYKEGTSPYHVLYKLKADVNQEDETRI